MHSPSNEGWWQCSHRPSFDRGRSDTSHLIALIVEEREGKFIVSRDNMVTWTSARSGTVLRPWYYKSLTMDDVSTETEYSLRELVRLGGHRAGVPQVLLPYELHLRKMYQPKAEFGRKLWWELDHFFLIRLRTRIIFFSLFWLYFKMIFWLFDSILNYYNLFFQFWLYLKVYPS